MNQDKIEILNRTFTSKEIESVIKNLPTMTQMNLSMKQKQTHREQTCGWQGLGGGEGWMDWEFGISRCKLLYTEWLSNKVLLYSTGNYIQYPVINHNGKKYEKEGIYMYN